MAGPYLIQVSTWEREGGGWLLRLACGHTTWSALGPEHYPDGALCGFCVHEAVVGQARRSYRPGIEMINSGQCPLGRSYSIACWFCPQGHATECHHPMDCETANCGHYRQAQALEEKHRGD